MLPRRGLLGAVLGLPVHGLVAGRGWMSAAQAAPLPARRTRILEFHVAGSYYYRCGGGGLGPTHTLVGKLAQLKRAPENRYDPLAIEVWIDGRMSGHVPRPHNEVLARLMDAGDKFELSVIAVDEGPRPLRMELHRLGGP